MTIVQAMLYAAANTSSTRRAKTFDLLDNELLLHTIEQRLAFGERQAHVSGCLVFGGPVKPHDLNSLHHTPIAVIELKNDRASHGDSLSRSQGDDTLSCTRLPAFLTASLNTIRTQPTR